MKIIACLREIPTFSASVLAVADFVSLAITNLLVKDPGRPPARFAANNTDLLSVRPAKTLENIGFFYGGGRASKF
jgi:hypothetical protein